MSTIPCCVNKQASNFLGRCILRVYHLQSCEALCPFKLLLKLSCFLKLADESFYLHQLLDTSPSPYILEKNSRRVQHYGESSSQSNKPTTLSSDLSLGFAAFSGYSRHQRAVGQCHVVFTCHSGSINEAISNASVIFLSSEDKQNIALRMECNFKAFEKMLCYFHLDKNLNYSNKLPVQLE